MEKIGLGRELNELPKSLNLQNKVVFEDLKEKIVLYILNAKINDLLLLHERFTNILIESITLDAPIVVLIMINDLNILSTEHLNTSDLGNKINIVMEKHWDEDLAKKSLRNSVLKTFPKNLVYISLRTNKFKP